jgi:membrane fusion protein, multidrug efflux system
MNNVHIIIILLVLLGLFSCKQKTDDKKDKPPEKVEVIIAEAVNFPTNIEVNGSTLSEEMIQLFPEISGRITFLNLPDGSFVEQGTVLVKINDADLQAQLEQQNVALDLAKKTEARLKQLLAINGVDQATYDVALSEVNTRNANIKVISAQIDKTVIKAPFSGKLGLRQVSVGAFVTPQTLLGSLQTDKIKIDFTVPDTYKSMVNVGDIVSIQTTSSIDTLEATISAIETQISTSTRNIKIRAKLNNGNINPGSFVKVLLHKLEKGIVVPTNAIIPDALSDQVVIIKNGKAIFKNVETGTRSADLVKLNSGIEAGDTIVVSGVLFVRPNAKVKISKVKKIGDGK